MSTVVEATEPTERSLSESLRLFLGVTRPRVMALVVFTGLPALVLGKAVRPSAWEAFWVLLGTAAAGGASSAFNAYYERETDAFMARTRNRPLPASSILPRTMVVYGALLTLVSTVVLAVVGGWLSVLVALGTIAFYVFGYTVYLKPRTPQNIVIGGAAGGTAPLIASAAIDGHISVGAWILFLIIFLWTPPHFWSVAIVRKKEYAAAGLPMMPSAVGDQGTRWRSLGYTVALLPVTVLPFALGQLGPIYGLASVLLGAWFLALVGWSIVVQQRAFDWRVFKASVGYLSLLFLFMLVDLAIPWGTT